jgi:hypothetical protein
VPFDYAKDKEVLASHLFSKFLYMADDLIVAEEDIDLAVIDANQVEDFKAKEQKKARVMELIKEE